MKKLLATYANATRFKVQCSFCKKEKKSRYCLVKKIGCIWLCDDCAKYFKVDECEEAK